MKYEDKSQAIVTIKKPIILTLEGTIFENNYVIDDHEDTEDGAEASN